MYNVRRMEKAMERREKKKKTRLNARQPRLNVPKPNQHCTHVIGPGWTLDINWQDSSKRVGNPKTSRKESDVAVTLARPLQVSKVGQRKEKGKTKQATLISDFHAHGSKSSLWLIRLARS